MIKFIGAIIGSDAPLPVNISIPWHGVPMSDAVAVVDIREGHTTNSVYVEGLACPLTAKEGLPDRDK